MRRLVPVAPFFIASQSLAPEPLSPPWWVRFEVEDAPGTRFANERPPVSRAILPSSRRRSLTGALPRGFTLIELLAVVAMISVLVVAASPTFVRLMRDRRVNRATMQLVDYLRTGRAMAIGRGQPILVSWNAQGNTQAPLGQPYPGGTGYIELDEPLVTTNAAATLCSTTAWHTPATQKVNGFDLQNGQYVYTAVTFYDDAGATPSYAEICFTAQGRMYIRDGSSGAATGAFHAVVGVPYFLVFNTSNNPGMVYNPLLPFPGARVVYVPPNGVARMGL